MEKEIISYFVTKNYRTAAVFKKYGIDFCCGGKISIEDACKKTGVNQDDLLNELEQIMQNKSEKDTSENIELDVLANHIIRRHHSYIRTRIPEIEPFLDKVVDVHGLLHPELKKVQEIFLSIKTELMSHIQKEEDVLFPHIINMVQTKKEGRKLISTSFGSIKKSIIMMEEEHESAGKGFKEIRNITNNLTSPQNVCNTYCVTFSMLDEFENDLHKHIHLENNILFPKAILLEKEILSI